MATEKETESKKKLPYSPPRITRVRLDPDGAVLSCRKTSGNCQTHPNNTTNHIS